MRWIVAVGNRFRQDDGLALQAVQQVKEQGLPPGVRVLTHAQWPLPAPWQPGDRVLLLDAVHAPRLPAGTLVDLSAEDLQSLPPGFRGSSHSLGLQEWLAVVALNPGLPAELRFLGLVGQHFGFGEGLSKPVAQALPRLIHEIFVWLRATEARR